MYICMYVQYIYIYVCMHACMYVLYTVGYNIPSTKKWEQEHPHMIINILHTLVMSSMLSGVIRRGGVVEHCLQGSACQQRTSFLS